MKRGLLVFLAICAFAIAMVPKDRHTEIHKEETTRRKEEEKKVCGPYTPCFWSVYRSHVRIIDFNVTNTYCICGPGTFCVQDEEDTVSNPSVYKCREPRHDEKKDDN